MFSAIAVIGRNREIGKKNQLIFSVPGDLPRFKKITIGHPIIMGRNTYESIGRPLLGRTNIVVSSTLDKQSEGIVVVDDLDQAVEIAKKSPGSEEIFIIGGGKVFAASMDKVDRLYLTIVEAEEPEADSFFPDYSYFTKIISEESHEEEGVKFRYLTLERV